MPFTVAGRLPRALARGGIADVIDRFLGLDVLQQLYEESPAPTSGRYARHALDVLGVRLEIDRPDRVPDAGGLLAVANHPFGALDGLALLELLERRRDDVRVIGNELLASIPELRPLVIAVDAFGRGTKQRNAGALRAALQWLRRGGCVLAFPAGEVAHRLAGPELSIDAPWRSHIADIAVRSGASVLPVFVPGANSARFRAAGKIHPLLRTLLLPRELLHRRGTTVRLHVGEAISAASLERLDPDERAAYLKTRTYLVGTRTAQRIADVGAAIPHARVREPVAPQGDRDAIAADVSRLPPDRWLVESGSLRVFCAAADELPHVLPELGRLRELTFRAAGEGTGFARDLDSYDASYRHLVAWDGARSRIAGAYRLGLTREIVSRYGAAGLYTRTLFEYDERLLAGIGAAIELGRSFVCQEYQRGFSSLLALWRGIGAFVVQHPECRSLFGAVSISSRYDSLSRHLLVRFLSEAARHPTAARLVRPKRPLPAPPDQAHVIESATLRTLEGVSGLVAAIEPDAKNVPVLVRQYLSLNARLLGFSVDPAFGDALDGLMLADLMDVPLPMLVRLMGKQGARAFTAYHAAIDPVRGAPRLHTASVQRA